MLKKYVLRWRLIYEQFLLAARYSVDEWRYLWSVCGFLINKQFNSKAAT